MSGPSVRSCCVVLVGDNKTALWLRKEGLTFRQCLALQVVCLEQLKGAGIVERKFRHCLIESDCAGIGLDSPQSSSSSGGGGGSRSHTAASEFKYAPSGHE